MPAAGGLESSLGIGEEITAGAPVVVSRFLEFDKEGISQELERVTHSGLRLGRKTLGANNYRVGRESNSGDIEMALTNKGNAILFKHMLGNVVTTTPVGATTARSHKATVGQLDGKSLSVQVGLYDDTATARPKTFAGAKVVDWELSGKENEHVMLKLGVDAIAGTFSTPLAVPSYPVGLADYFSTDTVVKIAGAEVECSEWSVKGKNSLADERFYLQSTSPGRKKQQLESDLREYEGELKVSFPDLAAYNRYANNTNASVQITMTGSIIEAAIAYKIDILIPAVDFTGETPEVDGPGIIEISLPFTILDNGTADSPISVTCVNNDLVA